MPGTWADGPPAWASTPRIELLVHPAIYLLWKRHPEVKAAAEAQGGL